MRLSFTEPNNHASIQSTSFHAYYFLHYLVLPVPCLYCSATRRVDYDVPVPYEEELEPVQDFYEAAKTQEFYFLGKQIPLDHIDPMFYEMVLFDKVHAMFYEMLFHV